MKRTLRLALVALGASLAVGALSDAASAQSYPNKPLRMVIPFAAGGSPDIIGRMVAEELGTMLGQSVVVENRAGAGGNIAVQYVIDQPADGYTLLLGTSGNMASNKVLYNNLKFDTEVDLIPISVAYTTCNALIVPEAGPKTVAELIAEAKAKPGTLSFGSPGVGTAGHLIGELFKTTTGTQLTHVPYRGQSQVINDLLGGHLSMSFEVAATAIPVVQSGKMRALAVTCPRRLAQLPDTPIFSEAGIQGFVLEGLAAGRGARQDAARHREEAERGDGEDHELAEGERQDRRHGIAGAKFVAGRGADAVERRRQALGRGGEGGRDSAARLGSLTTQ